MTIYIMRHGEALAEGLDSVRPLTTKGSSDVKKVAQALKAREPDISLILQSGKKRAEQTADIMHQQLKLKCPIELNDKLSPNDPIHYIYELIIKREYNLMVVGHLPFLSRLTSKLVAGKEEDSIVHFSPGSLAVLEYMPHKNWEVVQFFSP